MPPFLASQLHPFLSHALVAQNHLIHWIVVGRSATSRVADHGLQLWGACAYKGGDTSSSDVPIPADRQANCQSWADAARQFNMRGLIATAWSRTNTVRMQKSPPDAALDMLVLCGHILKHGHPHAGGRDHALALLDQLGERARFDACYATMTQLANARKDFWRDLQTAREAVATSLHDRRRQLSGDLALHLVRLRKGIEVAQDAADKSCIAFAGLVEPIWIQRYLAERLDPMREEFALLEPKIKSLEPAARAAK